MSRIRRIASDIATVLVLAVVAGWIAVEWLARESISKLRSEDIQQTATRVVLALPAFEEDRRALAGIQLLAAGPETRDAGPLLNPLLRWESAEAKPTAVDKWRSSLPAAARELDAARFIERFKTYAPNSWPAHAKEFDYSAIDLSWMSRLGEFDYWDLDRHSPLEVASQTRFDPLTLPGVDFSPLFAYAKLRLMKGVAEGKLDSALAETHQLARLLATTHDQIATQWALSLLHVEGVFRAGGLTAPGPAAAPEPSDESIDRARRALSALPAFYSPTIASPVRQRILGSSNAGICIAAEQASRVFSISRVLVDPRSEWAREIDAWIAAPGCRPSTGRTRWAHWPSDFAHDLALRWDVYDHLLVSSTAPAHSEGRGPYFQGLIFMFSSSARLVVSDTTGAIAVNEMLGKSYFPKAPAAPQSTRGQPGQ